MNHGIASRIATTQRVLLLVVSVLLACTVRAAEVFPDQGRMPILFIANQGQTDSSVEFYARARGRTLFFTREGIVFSLARSGDESRERLTFSLDFEGGSPAATIEGGRRDSGRVNYLIGSNPSDWRSGIAVYRDIFYRDIYPGIDLRLYDRDGVLAYDFIVSPAGSPETIALAYRGIESLSVESEELAVGTAFGEIRQHRPFIYQEIGDEKVEVAGGFRLAGDRTYGFWVGDYDRGRPLVIDPDLAYSTLLGGSDWDVAESIAVGPDGSVYVTGYTRSLDFPTVNPVQGDYPGGIFGSAAFVARISADGETLVYSTYLGGSDGDRATGIAVDPDGRAYVAGSTSSADFPTVNAYQGTRPGSVAAFLARFSPEGGLEYSTFLGGSDRDDARSVIVDPDNRAYVVGSTRSADFPTVNPVQGDYPGGDESAFAARFSPDGSTLEYSTYLGGSDSDSVSAVAVDPDRRAYVTGYTRSLDFPTVNPVQGDYPGGDESAFAARFSPDGSALEYSTYLGGSQAEIGRGIAVDSAGRAYLTGNTLSADFPTANALQAERPGTWAAFLTRLSPDGSALEYSTYLGGSGNEIGYGVAADADGRAYAVGMTSSTDFPTAHPYQAANAGSVDAYLTVFSPDGEALEYSTYLGGGADDQAHGVALGPAGAVYLTGYTASADFPLVNPYHGSLPEPEEFTAFIARFGDYQGEIADGGIQPNSGSWTGGYQVVISGTNLGDGGDITNVTLAGVSVDSIVSQSATQIVVVAGQASSAGVGDVRVFSTSYGETAKSNAFEYLKEDQTISFPAIPDQLTTNTVGLAATAGSGLPVSFSVLSGPASISDGTNLTFTGAGQVGIVASQAGDALWNPAPEVTNTFGVFSLDVSSGPFAGGNTITIEGDFGTVTNVLVGGVAADIEASGDNWVTIVMPEVGSYGIKDVVIQTSDAGETTLSGAYTVGARAQDLPLGSVVYDDDWMWDGQVLGWRVVHTNYGGEANTVTLQATNSVGGRALIDGGWNNRWQDATLRTWLDSTNFLGVFSPAFSGIVMRTSVPWALSNPVNAPISGVTTDQVFIASRTELGGTQLAGDGSVFDWFADPGTAAARRGDMSPSAMNYWTRTGERAQFDGQWYDMTAYYVNVPAGTFAAGAWTSDGLQVVPVVNISGAAEFLEKPDGRFKLFGPLDQTITFPNPGDQLTTNRVELTATATSGQNVSYTVLSGPANVENDSALLFTNAGEVVVMASQPGNAYWNPAPDVTNTFNVTKAVATVTLTNLSHTYDGTAKAAVSETSPTGLTVIVTYDGDVASPTNAGSYTVVGIIDDMLYQGGATGTLVIAQADQTIDFSEIADQYVFDEVGLTASASSELPVSFSVLSGPGSIAGDTNLTFTGPGIVSIVASQAGDTNWNPAPNVTNTFRVYDAPVAGFGGALDFADGRHITIPGHSDINLSGASSFTLSMWVHRRGDGTLYRQRATVDHELQVWLRVLSDGSLLLGFDKFGIGWQWMSPPAGYIPPDQWIHIVITKEGTAVNCFLDGELVMTGTLDATRYGATAGTGLKYIGSDWDDFHFDGMIDEVQLWNAALSPEMLASWMYREIDATHPNYASLLFHYKLNEASGAVAVNSARDNHHGTLVNFTDDYRVPSTIRTWYTRIGEPLDGNFVGSWTDGSSNDGLDWTLGFDIVTNGSLGTATESLEDNSFIYTATNHGIDTIHYTVADPLGAVSPPYPVEIHIAPPAPNALPATDIGETSFQANWESVDGVTDYELDVSTDSLFADYIGGYDARTVADVMCVVTGTTPGQVYFYRVRALGDGGISSNSATIGPVAFGIITNVVPGAANVGGGIEVLIQGLNLGGDITNATLAGIEATILTQNVHDVTVRAGMAPAAVTGDVLIASASVGPIVLSNAFEYLWLDAPVQYDPVDITPSNLVARWLPVPAADTHFLEVGLDTNFTAHLVGYEWEEVFGANQYPVDGLTDGEWYAIRLFAWNDHGLSHPSRTVWVPAGSNTPYEEHPPLSGPISEGAISEFDLSHVFHGAGLIYDVESSDEGVMVASITGDGFLRLDPVGPGTATITVTATDPVTGYTATYSFAVTVVGDPAEDANYFRPREPWNPRFEQVLELRNDSGVDAVGVRLLFSDLADGIEVENQTGVAWDGRPMIEMETPFNDGDTLELVIVYVCTGAFRVDEHPPTIEMQYILPAWRPPLPGVGVAVDIKAVLPDGRIVLEFDTVPGALYAIEYMNNFPGGGWVEVPLRIRAGANRTQWIDSGPPATLPMDGMRAYRIKRIEE